MTTTSEALTRMKSRLAQNMSIGRHYLEYMTLDDAKVIVRALEAQEQPADYFPSAQDLLHDVSAEEAGIASQVIRSVIGTGWADPAWPTDDDLTRIADKLDKHALDVESKESQDAPQADPRSDLIAMLDEYVDDLAPINRSAFGLAVHHMLLRYNITPKWNTIA